MRRFWKKGEDRADWPEPRAEFLQLLSNEIRGARSRVRSVGLRLALVVVVALALLVPLTAFAGNSGQSGVRDAVKAVFSSVQADSKSSTSRDKGGKRDDDDDDNGKKKKKKHDDDDDDNGKKHDDDDDDNGDYDYDKKCPNFGERRSALAHHQNQERKNLRAHQRTPHPGQSKKALRRHFKAEWRTLHAHQKAEREQLKKECGKGKGKGRKHDDDDDD